MNIEPIRVRLIPRDNDRFNNENPKVAFWQAIHLEGDYASHEGLLCKKFGIILSRRLIEYLSDPQERLHRYRRGFHHPSMRDDREKFDDIYEELWISRKEKRIEDYREKIIESAEVIFTVKNISYSSISFDLLIGGLTKLIKVFDNDFELFSVFLDVFIPQAFEDTFDGRSLNMDCNIQIPSSVAQAFALAATLPQSSAGVSAGSSSATAREKAQWLWKLANGSLLVPFLLTIGTVYIGISTLNDIQKTQNEMMKPILEHHIKLLEEDRHRLFKESGATHDSENSPVKESISSPTSAGSSVRKKSK